ncbi:MAG TPA: hypothetical protein VMU26_30970 [Candidatus Polarisedimenticolia bacterium]|nr:hypothetical protein [Candidatus Polarisedimenticolia bacterium]
MSAEKNGLTEMPFDGYSARTQKYKERAYGIRVVTRDIPDPLTGDSTIRKSILITPSVRNSACSR